MLLPRRILETRSYLPITVCNSVEMDSFDSSIGLGFCSVDEITWWSTVENVHICK